MKVLEQLSIHCNLAPRGIQLLAAAACLALVACSGGESGPQQGSPEWYWAAAEQNIAMGDYAKADEQIEAVTKSDGELATKAILWRATLLAGLTTGYDVLADAFTEGQGNNNKQAADFQTFISEYRRQTRQNAIELAESTGKLKEAIGDGESVVLEFPLPDGAATESPILSTVQNGRVPRTEGATAESTTLASQTLTRAILQAAASLSGTDDAANVRSSFSAGSATVSRTDFEVAMARYLLDTSIMFDRQGLNEPKIRTLVFAMAQKWAEPYLDHEDYKDWAEDFKFDVINEERDKEGKTRIKKKD